jgi:hypothetical protein
MNLIIDNYNRVVFTNPNSQKLSGVEAYENFDSAKHKIIYATDYWLEVGEEIPKSIIDKVVNGVLPAFKPYIVYDVNYFSSRMISDWFTSPNFFETESKPIEGEAFQKFVDGKFEIDIVNKLNHFKTEKYNEIETGYDEALKNGFEFEGNYFEARPIDQSNLTSEISGWSIGLTCSPVWRTRDNINIEVDKLILTELATALKTFVFNTIKKRWEFKYYLEIAKTIEEINTIEVRY